ncbi:MAG: TonB-dependent receptor [Gammaproteobacteria bacterium]|nr:TonB-dependent receptor [Gammaproteobacteria bacterium]
MHLKVNLGRLAITACCVVCVQSAWADVEIEHGSSSITAADIQREHPASVSDLLRTRAGLDDSSGTITMRGVLGVAVVLNGLPSTLTDVNQLNLQDIERIEIFRGAASARFGSNAMGGAIVVTTRKNAEAHPVLTLLGSSSGSLGARFGGDWNLNGWQAGLSLKDEDEHGYKAVTQAPFANQITVEEERSRSKAISLRGGYREGESKLGVELKQTDSLARFGRPNWWEHYVVDGLRVDAATPLAGAVLEAQAGREVYDDPGLLDRGTGTDAASLVPDRYILGSGSKSEGELALAWQDEQGSARIGTAYKRSRDRYAIRPYGSSSDIFVLDSVTVNQALLAHLDQRVGAALKLALDGRLDRYEYPEIYVYDAAGTALAPSNGVSKQAFNPKLELNWEMTERSSLRASAGTGFVAPTPDQLYYSDKGAASWMLGNPDLKPQRSRTWDIGVNQRVGESASFSATYFHTSWTDKIGVAIVDYGTPLVRQYANIGAAKAQGLELESRLKPAQDWTASLNYTYNHALIVRDDAHPERVGNTLADMPRHKLNAALGYESGDISGRLALRALSAAWTDEANTVADAQGYRWKKCGYAVLDASLTWRIDDAEIVLALDNVFDRRYTTGFFRTGQPRLLRVEASWSM